MIGGSAAARPPAAGLLAVALAMAAGAASSLAAQGIELELDPLASGLFQPAEVTHAGDGSGRIFIVEQDGRIRIHDGTTLLPTPFLDISNRLSCCGERGLLSLAFHPDYPTTPHFFVSYTDPVGDSVVSRFSVSAGDPDLADPDSELVLLQVDQPFFNHNVGQLAFGPDGYLYVGSGDGGFFGDPDDRAQDLTTLLGKLLRIDVDNPDPGLEYGIPPSNPFFDDPPNRGEIWAYGLRNPWRFAFDRLTGDLYLGDVGQDSIEEIDFQPAASGGGENYGWRLMEGSQCFNPPVDCDDGSLTLPVMEYDHGVGCSVIGGEVYRGFAQRQLQGIYLFSDFCAGQIWGTVPRCDGVWEFRSLLDNPFLVSALGRDESGEVYVTQFVLDVPQSAVHRLRLVPGSGGPLLGRSPEVLDFGAVLVGQTVSLELLLTNTNAGPEALQIQAMGLTDPVNFALDFGAGAAPCGGPAVCLGPGASCTLGVGFTPTEEGYFLETIELDLNSPIKAVPLVATAAFACGHPLTVELEDDVVESFEQFVACAWISAGRGYVVNFNGDLSLIAGHRVVFADGFAVRSGGRMTVTIDESL